MSRQIVIDEEDLFRFKSLVAELKQVIDELKSPASAPARITTNKLYNYSSINREFGIDIKILKRAVEDGLLKPNPRPDGKGQYRFSPLEVENYINGRNQGGATPTRQGRPAKTYKGLPQSA
ncbi:MAG: hypothetical protein JW783_08380 [Bacteroidales bacterium]|nr:hypothetical protein [Bacteroidales bacterium]MBN2749958.1 hypothetical protein [Bacteroidales bacterium]